MSFQIKQVRMIEQIDRECWQQCINTDYPFVQYDYLYALEASGSVSPDTGWTPRHILVESEGEVVAIIPFYLKTHSYGEYVFDFQWANAYHQQGLEYYPKLLCAIPYTPVSGKRLFCTGDVSEDELFEAVTRFLKVRMQAESIETLHWLFSTHQESELMCQYGVSQRLGMQYHWFNRDYKKFDDFLAKCNKKHRNNIKRERRKAVEQNLTISRYQGDTLTDEIWQSFFLFYQLTYVKRSGHGGYLNQDFFDQVGRSLADQILIVGAHDESSMIAASLFFYDGETLYGRYWGCQKEFECLHFELCYYQGIEFCIDQGLKRFDAGAQGEHKIKRGFEPVITYSNHWVANPAFRDAISRFLDEEARVVRQLLVDASASLPYK